MNPLDSRELAASMVLSSRLLAGGIVRSIVVSFQSGRDPVLEVARETPAGITCGKIGIFSDAWPVLRQAFKAWEQREVRDFRHRSLSINVNGPLLGIGLVDADGIARGGPSNLNRTEVVALQEALFLAELEASP